MGLKLVQAWVDFAVTGVTINCYLYLLHEGLSRRPDPAGQRPGLLDPCDGGEPGVPQDRHRVRHGDEPRLPGEGHLLAGDHGDQTPAVNNITDIPFCCLFLISIFISINIALDDFDILATVFENLIGHVGRRHLLQSLTTL